jgi:hypothetical protein
MVKTGQLSTLLRYIMVCKPNWAIRQMVKETSVQHLASTPQTCGREIAMENKGRRSPKTASANAGGRIEKK